MPTSEWALRFWKWADALGHWYFNEELAQRQVRLHWPTHENFSGREDDFLQVLRQWSPFRGPVEVACELSRRWNPRTGEVTLSWAIPELPRDGRCDRPPYLPYLVAFAMAWETEGDFESNAYYPRLNQILGQQKTPINSGSFMHADGLWSDLEHWAENIMDGDLGRFTAVTLGGMEHIGYPMSQVVLKPAERHQLGRIFAREGLTRDMALSDQDIQELLAKHHDQFGSRIKRSIETAGSRFARALFEEVRIELANAVSPEAPRRTRGGGRQAGESTRQIRLQLACRMGLHSICGWFFTSASDGDDLPDATGGGYAFRPGHVDGVLWQQPDSGMATPDVAAFTSFNPLNARLALQADDGTPVVWPGHDVRFLSPSRARAGVYVERDFVPDRSPIIVICGGAEAELVRRIAVAEVPGVTWQGVSAWRVDSPRDLVEAFPKRRNYARPTSIIRCTGGIRCYPHAAEYFPFSLPRIVVDEGWQPKAQTPGVALEETEEDSVFRLRVDTCEPPNGLAIEATREGMRTHVLDVSVCNDPTPRRCDGSVDASEQPGDAGTVALDPIPAWPDGIGKRDVSLEADVGSCLMTFLSSWGECSYGTWVRATDEIIGPDCNCASRIARGMILLGHVSMGVDRTTGHWKRVVVAPGRLRCLPWDMDVSGDRFPQAVIEGQCIWTHLLAMLRSLPGDVDYDITPQPVTYLPPRVRLYALERSSLRDAASRMGLQYEGEGRPEGSMDDAGVRLEDLEWHDGLMGTGDGVLHFSPLLLDDVDARGQRYEDLCRISGDLLLATQTETYGATHCYLCDLGRNRRARLPQGERQWARWLCYRAAAKRFLSINHGGGRESSDLAMPYTAVDGQVILPYGLMPPPAIAKAFVACTGLLPTVAWGGDLVDAVGTLDQSTMDSFTHPFVIPKGSPVAIYDRVPAKVAQGALGALGVTLSEPETGVLDGSSD